MGLLTEIEKVGEEFCDKYCKYPDMYNGKSGDEENDCDMLFKERCANCPITKL